MPTQRERRRAIGERIVETRREIAERLPANRRAIGEAIVARRRGTAVVEDINSLVQPVRARRTLRTVAPVGALPTTRGRAYYVPPAVVPGAGGGGIASPVVEQSYAAREYWPNGWPSNDGLLLLPAWKRVVMTDANGAEVIFDYAEPV